MSGFLRLFVHAILLELVLSGFSHAQELPTGDDGAPQREESWYREQPAYKPDIQAIIHQKAQIRGDQRQARLASLSWYGMSNSRPTGAPTPFTSRYSPVWEMPGGRPFAWYPYARPGYVMYWR
jgi:hypothetical protein